MQKLINKVRKLYEQHSESEIQQAIQYIQDENIWQAMDSQQREQFFRDQCARFGFSILEGTRNPARCLFVEEFKKAQTSNHPTKPYFMFWRASTSHQGRGHIEFGHWHMDRKLEKQYPGTEYCYGGPKEQQALMEKYAKEIE